MKTKYALGLDVAKLSISACLLDSSLKAQRTELLNSISGFEQLVIWLHGIDPMTVHVCLEPTGKYSHDVAVFLLERGFKVSQVNSYTVLSHGRSKGVRGKYDRIDAYLLADFCIKENPPSWVPAAKAQAELREVENRLQELAEMIGQEKNRLEAGIASAAAKEDTQSHIAELEARKQRLEKEARRIADQDTVLKQNFELISSIIGLGERSSLRLLAYVQFSQFEDSRSVGCFAGLTPRRHESGTSIHRHPCISRVGSSELRQMLYYPAMVAIQHNPQMRAFAERLAARGKPPKVVICAVMRKLLVLAATLVRKQQFYDCAHGLVSA